MPRLLELAAGQTAHLINMSNLSGPFHLSRPTIREYVTLLERLFLIDELPAWHTNQLKRLVKTPKLHMGDTGFAASLLGSNATDLLAERVLYGQLLETFVYAEIRKLASWSEELVRLSHYRDRHGVETDLVLEKGRRSDESRVSPRSAAGSSQPQASSSSAAASGFARRSSSSCASTILPA